MKSTKAINLLKFLIFFKNKVARSIQRDKVSRQKDKKLLSGWNQGLFSRNWKECIIIIKDTLSILKRLLDKCLFLNFNLIIPIIQFLVTIYLFCTNWQHEWSIIIIIMEKDKKKMSEYFKKNCVSHWVALCTNCFNVNWSDSNINILQLNIFFKHRLS